MCQSLTIGRLLIQIALPTCFIFQIQIIVVSTHQPFADGTKIHLAVVGSLGPSIGNNVSGASVGFIGAYPYGLNESVFTVGSPMWGVDLRPNSAMPSGTEPPKLAFGGPYLVGEATDIEFRNSGDYSPSIQIAFTNHSEPITYTYQNYKMHVESSASLRQYQINYAVGVVTFGGFLFAVFDVVPYLKKKNKKN